MARRVQAVAASRVPLERCGRDGSSTIVGVPHSLALCLQIMSTLHLSIFLCIPADWSSIDPMEYLTPFMEVIRSHETSGPVTGVALTAVSRFLDAYIVGMYDEIAACMSQDQKHHFSIKDVYLVCD